MSVPESVTQAGRDSVELAPASAGPVPVVTEGAEMEFPERTAATAPRRPAVPSAIVRSDADTDTDADADAESDTVADAEPDTVCGDVGDSSEGAVPPQIASPEALRPHAFRSDPPRPDPSAGPVASVPDATPDPREQPGPAGAGEPVRTAPGAAQRDPDNTPAPAETGRPADRESALPAGDRDAPVSSGRGNPSGQQDRPGRAPGGRPAVRELDFFGRQRELQVLHEDIGRAGLNTIAGRKEPRARVLLIAGRPGSGRTALAERLTGQLRDRYPDGCVMTRLSESDGEPVPTERTAREILAAFDVPAPPGGGEDELSGMVRDALAERRVLLLLDDAVDAGQVDPFVPGNPECLVIAVAKGPLTGIPDVRPCTLGGMEVKAAVELITRFTGTVRITVDPQAAESLVEVCGGQPAALMLVGGWLAARPTASVADVAKQLRALPDPPERPAADRALARAFQLVHASLSPAAARMLRLLALAPAGQADAHTASALAGCSVPDAAGLLDDFAVRGLLRPADEPAPGRPPAIAPVADAVATGPSNAGAPAGPPAAGRTYLVPGCLVPLMRALLDELDRPGDVQLATARMLERTVRLLQSCRVIAEPEESPARKRLATLPQPLRFPNAAAAAEWLRVRQPALLASARIAVADGELDTLARRLIAALVRALAAHRGTEASAPELYGLHQLVLDIAERGSLYREQAAALLNIGDLDARTGRTQEALTRFRAALDAGRAAHDLYATGRAMESVGGAYQDLQDWQRAADWYGRALAQRLNRGELAEEARLYGRLGAVHTYAGRYGEALRDWRASAACYRRLHDPAGHARALSEAARVQEYAGRPDDSLRTCEEAVEWARLAGDTRLQAALEIRLAAALDRLGDPTAARLHRDTADRLLGTADATCESRSTSAGK